MKHKLLFAALVAAATVGAQAQSQAPDLLGDWQGTLRIPDEIHLTLHISAGDNGALKATMDSAEQGAKGVPITSIAFKDSKLTFAIDSMHVSYDGTLGNNTIQGTWSQGQPMPLNFARPPKSSGVVKRSDIEGVWQGTLQVGGQQLRFVFHITATAEGLAATMDSPDQAAAGLPVTSARREGDTLTLQMPDLGAKYQGAIAKDLSAIEGSFTQGGASLPLTLKRGSDAKEPEPRRPRNLKP
jgi:hypothetical protein